MNLTHKKLFGSGPMIAFFGIILAVTAVCVQLSFPHLFTINIAYHTEIAGVFFVLWLAMFVYSFVALPNKQKGNALVTDGLYRYIRHPLYAAFLTFFYFAVFLYSQSLWMLMAQIISIIIAGKVVASEEMFMMKLFGKEYEEYTKRTKKFIPFLF